MIRGCFRRRQSCCGGCSGRAGASGKTAPPAAAAGSAHPSAEDETAVASAGRRTGPFLERSLERWWRRRWGWPAAPSPSRFAPCRLRTGLGRTHGNPHVHLKRRKW